MSEKQIAIKVFDEREMMERDYEDMCIGDDERCHWYFYREPEPRHPNSADVTEDRPW